MADNEMLRTQIGELTEKRDFAGLLKLIQANVEDFDKYFHASGVRTMLRKATDDRLILSFVDGANFGPQSLPSALGRLDRLLSLKQGTLVLSKAWGVGQVTRLDYFYKRVTVDFRVRRGHQFTYDAAIDMLTIPPEDHVLVMQRNEPEKTAQMLKEASGDFVVRMIRSFGPMPVGRLEELCEIHAFVKPADWKKFWEAARTQLKKNKFVEIPVKRSDDIVVLDTPKDSDAAAVERIGKSSDPKEILAMVVAFSAEPSFKSISDDARQVLAGRLEFAATAARKVDHALYARIAGLVSRLGFERPSAQEVRDYLWERKRFVKAAETLPAREVGDLVRLLAVDDDSKARLYAAIPQLCFTAVTEVVSQFGADPACRKAVGDLLKGVTDANGEKLPIPPTLLAFVVGHYDDDFAKWAGMPPLSSLMALAISLGEGRQSGETLKMQNIVRRLFADCRSEEGGKKGARKAGWLIGMFNRLTPEDRVFVFERFQSSTGWDPASHHVIVVNLVRAFPELEPHLVRQEKKKEYARVTSLRSFAMRKAEYLKLINEDMPANTKRIEFAKSYGDLSENAEYQYAKDEQRTLMQKQTQMQTDLETVKPADFANATTDEVQPGVMVKIVTPEGERTYSVLGEWDNELSLGIISSKAQLAQNMLGKKPGDSFELPGAVDHDISFGKIVEILPLSETVREWMKLPAGMQI